MIALFERIMGDVEQAAVDVEKYSDSRRCKGAYQNIEVQELGTPTLSEVSFKA